jgi:hypothetical protein
VIGVLLKLAWMVAFSGLPKTSTQIGGGSRAAPKCDVRFTPESCRGTCGPACPLWANSGLVQCNNRHLKVKKRQLGQSAFLCCQSHPGEKVLVRVCHVFVTISDTEGTVLAEIFILRLEVIARISPDVIPVSGRFVPLNPAAPIEFKNKSNNRRS